MSIERPSRRRSRYTLRDVARIAGVSTTTASLVLSHKGTSLRISEETHKRVSDAAMQLGYAPNLLQSSLRKGRTNVLSFYNCYRNREWGDLYMDNLASAIEHAAGKHGYNILSHCTFEPDPEDTYRQLNGGLSDGLILFAPSLNEPLLPLLRQSNLPTVVIHPRAEDEFLSSVREDGQSGMSQIADRLASSGHRRIAAATTDFDGIPDPLQRVSRLRQRLATHGIDLPEDCILTWKGDAKKTVLQVRSLSPQPTALFIWNDRAAYQVVEACELMGISVPSDLSVIGYDGIVWPAQTKHVVSSAKVPLDALALEAVLILDRLLWGEQGPISSIIPVSFLPGSTLGNIS